MIRRRPARSTGLLMNASVTNTDRSGVLVLDPAAGTLLGGAKGYHRAGQVPDRDEGGRDRAGCEDRDDDRPRPPSYEPGGQDRDRDPHHLEVLVHVEFDRAQDDDVRDDEQRHHPRNEEPPRGQSARGDGGDHGQGERDAEVGRVEEQDRERAVAEARLSPASDEAERAAAALLADRLGDERDGQDHRREEEDRIAAGRRGAPGPGREHVEADDEVRRRERIELEGRQERGDAPGQEDAGRPAAEARHHEQHDRDQPRQPERRRTVRQEAGPEHRGDPEEGPAVRPRVVVRVLADERRDIGLPASTSPTRRTQPIPPPRQARIVAMAATRRSPVSRRASAQTSSAMTQANSALDAK